MGPCRFTSPFLDFVPTSAEALNCPLVSPYTPLFSSTYSMSTLRRMAWQSWPMPMDRESPSPEIPTYSRPRLAALAPAAMEGMRPCTELKPWASFTKYAGVLDEQPMPESFATRCGSTSSSKNACTSAAVTESCPHPAHSVDMVPS